MSEFRPLVIYHAHCRDGFTAAWVVRHFLGDQCDFVPAQYGQDPPDCTGRDVYILDFSYKRPVMRRILSQARKVVVLDHHKTAQDELRGLTDEFCLRPDLIANPPGSELPVIRFDMDKSGARLTWEYFCPEVDPTRLVLYVEDRDLWRYELPCSRAINAAIESYPMTWENWSWLADRIHDRAPSLIMEGEAIERYKQTLVDAICKRAREDEIGGHQVLAVQTPVLFSEVAGQLAEGRPFGAAYFVREDGVSVYSLRSREGGIDVAKLAQRYGGGGHRNAAGFQIERPGSPGRPENRSASVVTEL